MSPLDDQLRSLLHARADVLKPAPDQLVGIERRARAMRRSRVAASVAGAALAVAAIAVAVPALVPDHDGGAGQVAVTPTPSAEPSARSYGPNELDPSNPWAYRGDPSVLTGGNSRALLLEWESIHPDSVINKLYGQVYEPSHQAEIVFVSAKEGDNRWGVATTSESGIEFLVDEPLPTPSTVLMAVLPGDEAPRLLILASPAVGDVSYAQDGASFRTIPGPGPGVGFVPLEGDTSHDLVRVLDGDGDRDHPVFLGPAPGGAVTSEPPSPSATPVTQPAETSSAPMLAARYAFDPASPWKYRGAGRDGTGDITSADRKQFVTDHGEQQGQQDTPLYVVHLSATTDVAVVLHTRPGDTWVSFTAHEGTATHQVAYQPTRGEDILSAYVPLDATHGLLIGVASDQAANLVLQTGDRAEVGGSRTAGTWDWAPGADPQARLAVFATGDAEPYSSQSAT